jgi:hypothetical protein
MYSGEYDVCDVTLSVYPHRASLAEHCVSIPKVVKNNFLRKIFFGTKGTNNLQVFNHLNLAALHYGHPLTTWFVGKFYTHTPPV